MGVSFTARIHRAPPEFLGSHVIFGARWASTKDIPIAPSIPFERPLFPRVPEAHDQNADKHDHLH